MPSRNSAKAILAATVLGALACAGCSDDKKPPQTEDDARTDSRPHPTAAKADVATPTSGSIQIDDEIIKLCGNIPTAHFAFDSASIAGDAAAALDPLATCFSTGPAKDKRMRMTGHTDPRGETEYNFALGQKRAGSVLGYLAQKGVDKARLEATSKGELEATGTDEQGWSRDRKVVISLAH
jgi:peptidoglycan-associated lipoprotein